MCVFRMNPKHFKGNLPAAKEMYKYELGREIADE